MDCIRSLIDTILVGANRALLVVLVLLFASAHAGAQPKIRSLTGIIEGHQVGGVTVDLIGNIYVANCRNNSIAKITPDGVVSSFAKSELFNCPNGASCDRSRNPS